MNISLRSSPNFNNRPDGMKIDMVLLHYTNMVDTEAALDRLCDPESEVSAHYLIDEQGKTFQLVEESQRAWHAGVAYWQGERDINGCSIGVELAHPGPREDGSCAPFPPAQMMALVDLRDTSAMDNMEKWRLLAS